MNLTGVSLNESNSNTGNYFMIPNPRITLELNYPVDQVTYVRCVEICDGNDIKIKVRKIPRKYVNIFLC